MKDLETGFSEVERRVKRLIADNTGLKKRISELEQELERARRESHELQNFHGKRLHIKEKIERILQSLEGFGERAGK